MFPSNGIKKTQQQQQKTTDFPRSSQPRPRVSGHCPTSWALNGVNSRLLSLQVNTPEVENSSAQKSDRNSERVGLFFHFFPIFFESDEFFIHKINMLHCFQLNVHDGSWKSDHFLEIYGLQFKKTFFSQYLVWKNLVPSTIPAAFLKKIDTHHRPPRLDVLNQVAGRWSCHPPRSRFHCRPSQRSPSLAQSSGYLGWMIRQGKVKNPW